MAERLEQLQQMLEKEPNDTFLLYGLAMEHKKAGNVDEALKYLDKLVQVDPEYCYAYYQRGQLFEMKSDNNSAKHEYNIGVVVAGKKGDTHAQDEIAGALAMIS